jgi:hypothetical protein
MADVYSWVKEGELAALPDGSSDESSHAPGGFVEFTQVSIETVTVATRTACYAGSVSSISILPATPTKNQGRNSDTVQLALGDSREVSSSDLPRPDLHHDSLMHELISLLKQGRGCSGSDESRSSKIQCRSASHSTAPTVPPISHDQSSGDDEQDLHSASCTTGGFVYLRQSCCE